MYHAVAFKTTLYIAGQCYCLQGQIQDYGKGRALQVIDHTVYVALLASAVVQKQK